MAKKKKNKRDFGGMVYSTNPEFDYNHGGKESTTLPPQEQNLRIVLQRFKGNKIATVIQKFEGKDADLSALGKLLKSKCGTGGSVKNGEIIIQGSKRDQVGEILKKEGYRFKFSGG